MIVKQRPFPSFSLWVLGRKWQNLLVFLRFPAISCKYGYSVAIGNSYLQFYFRKSVAKSRRTKKMSFLSNQSYCLKSAKILDETALRLICCTEKFQMALSNFLRVKYTSWPILRDPQGTLCTNFPPDKTIIRRKAPECPKSSQDPMIAGYRAQCRKSLTRLAMNCHMIKYCPLIGQKIVLFR